MSRTATHCSRRQSDFPSVSADLAATCRRIGSRACATASTSIRRRRSTTPAARRSSTMKARVHEKLIVIGMAYNRYMTLMLSESGRMLGGYDDFLCLIGTDVQDGMSNLFDRRQMPELP
ncbi:SUKH-3 domain-containing protein [Massilia mucilaginosa]|uniref:SUKH-3 domain-containing protein n=1 Tax=Massilia mucilaginosa TaxID=2609282 RepID=UPI002806529C|nr:SUKH-3 domain-containing protein [Massilia mucilaginosa]